MKFSAFTVIPLLSGLQRAFAVEHTVRRQLLANETECVLILQAYFQFKDHIEDELKWACGFTQEQSTQLGYENSILGIEGVSEAFLESQGAASGESFRKVKGRAFIEHSVANADNAKLVVPEEALVEIGTLPIDDPRRMLQQALTSHTWIPTQGVSHFDFWTSTLEPDCSDNPSFAFKGNPKKTCEKWVAKGKKKLHKEKKFKKMQKKCKKKVSKSGDDRIYDYCRETCALVGLGVCAE